MFDIIPKNSSLILAISGGPDSVYLLHRILKIQSTHKLTLHLAHFNHQTRKEESNSDEIFVKNLANKFDLPIYIKKSKSITSSEDKMRKNRYAFLEKTRIQTKSDYIVTAHHQNDQVETIVFNFFRGTGPTGLTGMKSNNNHILRPLLNTSKQTILDHLKNKNIKYRKDKSNLNINYKRNLIRQKILPLAKNINPKTDQSILQLAKIIKTNQDFIEFETNRLLKTYNNNFKTTSIFSLSKFKTLHPAIQSNLIKTIIQPHVPPNKQLTAKIIDEVKNILLHSRGGSQKILFDTLSISKKNDKIYLRLLR